MFLHIALFEKLLEQNGQYGGACNPSDIAMPWRSFKKSVKIVGVRIWVYPFPFGLFFVYYIDPAPLFLQQMVVAVFVVFYGQRLIVACFGLLLLLYLSVGVASGCRSRRHYEGAA